MVLALLALAGLTAIMPNAQTTPAAHAEPQSDLPGKKDMGTRRFGFHYFEAMPKDSRVPAAQAEVDRLFPPGSDADEFNSYFAASGAKCSRGTDYYGPYVTCIYHIQGLSLVSTDWTVTAYLESGADRSAIKNTKVTRYLTGL